MSGFLLLLTKFVLHLLSKNYRNFTFWDFVDLTSNENFFGKTLGSVSYPYSKEPSCKKCRKSLDPILRKSVHSLTNQPTTNRSDFMGPGDQVTGPKYWKSRKSNSRKPQLCAIFVLIILKKLDIKHHWKWSKNISQETIPPTFSDLRTNSNQIPLG